MSSKVISEKEHLTKNDKLIKDFYNLLRDKEGEFEKENSKE